jgi:hypothetical protein
MKTRFSLGSILISLLLIGGSCRDKGKEPEVIPDFWTIEEFAIDKNIKAELIHSQTNKQTDNEIILTLPSNYVHDYVIPIIKAPYAVAIYPKSGAKVNFENQRYITYRFTDRHGKWIEYKLYVRRSDTFKLNLSSQEYQLEELNKQSFSVDLPNVGTIDGRIGYEAVFFDENGNQKYSTIAYPDYRYLRVNFIFPQYFKSGSYQVKIRIHERSQPTKILRESEPISVNFLKSKYSTLLPPNPQLLQGQSYMIRGFGFSADRQYKLKLKNDFITSPIDIIGQYIDETQINFSLPNNLEEVDYEAYFLENDIPKKVWLPNNTIFFAKDNTRKSLVALFEMKADLFDYSFTNMLKSTYNKGERIDTPYFFYRTSNQEKFNLIMTNLSSGQEFNLTGTDVFLPSREYQYLSFTIPSNIPSGQYSIQGLKDGQKTTRYWKKIEIK